MPKSQTSNQVLSAVAAIAVIVLLPSGSMAQNRKSFMLIDT